MVSKLITLLAMLLLVIPLSFGQSEDLFINLDNVENGSFSLNAIETNIGSNIAINVTYDDAGFDSENDGVEPLEGVIDFTVASSAISTDLLEDNLCVRWEVASIDAGEVTTICHGNENCCNFMSMVPTRANWRETFFLTYGLYGATEQNNVSAQIVHVDYNTGAEPYSNIVYSEWASLPAQFGIDGTEQASGFLSFTVMSENESINMSVDSPDNETALAHGEHVHLNFTTNVSVDAFYSLDNSSESSLGSGVSFSEELIGSLAQGVLTNGMHDIALRLVHQDTNYSFAYYFDVADSTAPTLTLNATNNTAFVGDFLLTLLLQSDEYASIAYSLNGGGSTTVDLGSDKQEIISLATVNGQNTLTLVATDLQGNSKTEHYVFSFSPEASCSDGQQNGDETGIDCGGSCSACVPFSVTLEKTEFNVSEQVFVTVIARAYSTVPLIVTKDSVTVYEHTFTPVFEGAPISETRLITGILDPGTYQITAVQNYLNNTETQQLSFTVLEPPQSQLTVSISHNNTEPLSSDLINFTATVSGNTGTVLYEWDMQPDGSIESTEQSFVFSYPDNGSFTVSLKVTDDVSNSSASLPLEVTMPGLISVYVRNNATQNPLHSDVTLGGVFYNATGGLAVYRIRPGTYTLDAESDGYRSFTKNVAFPDSVDYYVNLTAIDSKNPQVAAIDPANNAQLSNKEVSFTFSASDDQLMTCRLYVDKSEGALVSANAQLDNVASGQSAFTITLENGTYFWKMDCRDRANNLNTTEVRSFTIGEEHAALTLTEEDVAGDQSIADLLVQIEGAQENLLGIRGKEKEVADDIDMKKLLERASLNLERAIRDINSLQWRRLNETGLEEERQKIANRIETVKAETPVALRVIDSTEFVKYPTTEDVEEAVKILLNQSGDSVTRKQLKDVVEQFEELQSKATITTDVKTVSVDYLGGSQSTITVVTRELDITSSQEDLFLYEIIPETVFSDVNRTKRYFEHELVLAFNTFEIDPEDQALYTYSIPQEVQLKQAENINVVLLTREFEIRRKGFVTGLAFIDDLADQLVNSSDIRLIVEIAIILLLAAIYLLYSFGGFEKIMHIVEPKSVKEFEKLMQAVNVSLSNNDYAQSSSTYKEITIKFKQLDVKQQSKFKAKVVDILYRTNLLYINQLVDQAKQAQNKQAALQTYKKIQSLYKIIPKHHKAAVSARCMELHQLLSAK